VSTLYLLMCGLRLTHSRNLHCFDTGLLVLPWSHICSVKSLPTLSSSSFICNVLSSSVKQLQSLDTFTLWTEKGTILFSSLLLEMLANLSEKFRQYSWGNAAFIYLPLQQRDSLLKMNISLYGWLWVSKNCSKTIA